MREQESMAEYRKQKQCQRELEIEKIKLKMKREYKEERKHNEKEQMSIQMNLPKLMISKFEGTNLDCQRIWSHFENEID